jgi:F-type H+-transporting ATPase subunit gamma
MANLKEIRGRIGSVKNTRKITSAMSRIAGARLVKAQQAALAARPYGERLDEVVRALVAGAGECEGEALHPLMTHRTGNGRVGLVLLTADRGLAGGFNANVNRAALAFIKREKAAGREVTLIAVGKKGRAFFNSTASKAERTHDAPTLLNIVERAKEVAAEVMALFEPAAEGQVGLPQCDAVFLTYNYFKSVLTQEPRTVQILPVKPPEASATGDVPVPPMFEPDRASLLGHLLPIAVEAQLQQAMFNSIAGEIAARRNAMESATDNAGQLIAELTLQYNRERQAAITKELMEIIGGAEALKG